MDFEQKNKSVFETNSILVKSRVNRQKESRDESMMKVSNERASHIAKESLISFNKDNKEYQTAYNHSGFPMVKGASQNTTYQ